MTEIKPNAAHWGFFDAVIDKGRVTEVRPFGPDPAPPVLLRSMADAVHAPSRIDQPYVRKGWLRGERAGTPRGGDAFVPVSWDKVTTLIAGEVARIRAEHGDEAIFGGSYGWSSAGRFHHAKSQLQRFLALGGGYTSSVNAYSYATAQALLPHVLGTNEVLLGKVTGWDAIARHAKIMLCFGGLAAKNGLVSAGGAGEHDYIPSMRRAVAAGVRLVNISPFRGDTEEELGADWIPIRPGTDTALMMGVAHELIALGRPDEAFLASHCVGWDKLKPTLAERSPEWASAITGVPVETIRALARDLAALPSMLTCAWSIQRADYGEQPSWMLVALAAMLGTIGKPGQGVAFGYGSINGMGTTSRRDLPSPSLPSSPNRVQRFIPVARIADLLENPGGTLPYNGRDLPLPDIRMVWWAGGNPFHHHQDLNRLLRAWSRPETIVVNEPWWTSVARHADIVLPATTTLERNDIGAASRDRYIRAMHQCVPAQGLARNDHDALADIADALGYRERFTEQRDEMVWVRHLYERWRVNSGRMGWEPPSFEQFWSEGHVEVPRADAPYTQFTDFHTDPQEHPLDTPTGKVELWSETIAGFNLPDCPPMPSWLPPRESLLSAADDELHLLSLQPPTRLHGQLDMGRVAAEAKIQGREPITISAADAAKRGLKAGDIVRIHNARGACLGGLKIREDLLEGVALMATGAWFDPLEPGVPGSLCVHGNPNVLAPDIATSTLTQGLSAQSCLVRLERWEGPLPPVKVHVPPPIELE